MQDRACAEMAPETFWSRKDWHLPSWRAPLAVPWSMPAERTPRDAVCDWEQISKIRARLYLRLDETCNFSRVTEGRPWTVRPGSGLQKTYSCQPPAPFTPQIDSSIYATRYASVCVTVIAFAHAIYISSCAYASKRALASPPLFPSNRILYI